MLVPLPNLEIVERLVDFLNLKVGTTHLTLRVSVCLVSEGILDTEGSSQREDRLHLVEHGAEY